MIHTGEKPFSCDEYKLVVLNSKDLSKNVWNSSDDIATVQKASKEILNEKKVVPEEGIKTEKETAHHWGGHSLSGRTNRWGCQIIPWWLWFIIKIQLGTLTPKQSFLRKFPNNCWGCNNC